MACLLLLMVACGQPPEGGQTAKPEVRLVEDVRLDAGPAFPLSTIRQVVPSEAGAVAVLDGLTASILVFGPEAEFRGAVGRAGEGPGEFESLFRVGLSEGTVWGVDSRRRSLSVFDEGRLSAQFQVAAGALAGAIPLSPIGADSVLLVSQTSGRIVFLLADYAASGVRELVAVDSSDRMWSLADGETSSLNQPLAPYPLASPWQKGVVVVRRAPADPLSAEYQVEWWGPGGRTESVSIPYAPVPVSEADIESALVPFSSSRTPEVMVRVGRFASESAVIDAARDRMVVPPTLPPVRGGNSGLDASSVRVGPSGTVWVERWQRGIDGSTEWDVVAPDQPVNRVSVPPGVRLMAVNSRYAWGVLTDEHDVPTIVRYRLTN
jgi:hypothetical protein